MVEKNGGRSMARGTAPGNASKRRSGAYSAVRIWCSASARRPYPSDLREKLVSGYLCESMQTFLAFVFLITCIRTSFENVIMTADIMLIDKTSTIEKMCWALELHSGSTVICDDTIALYLKSSR